MTEDEIYETMKRAHKDAIKETSYFVAPDTDNWGLGEWIGAVVFVAIAWVVIQMFGL